MESLLAKERSQGRNGEHLAAFTIGEDACTYDFTHVEGLAAFFKTSYHDILDLISSEELTVDTEGVLIHLAPFIALSD